MSNIEFQILEHIGLNKSIRRSEIIEHFPDIPAWQFVKSLNEQGLVDIKSNLDKEYIYEVFDFTCSLSVEGIKAVETYKQEQKAANFDKLFNRTLSIITASVTAIGVLTAIYSALK